MFCDCLFTGIVLIYLLMFINLFVVFIADVIIINSVIFKLAKPDIVNVK